MDETETEMERNLGFVPQKESEFNFHLPYASNLDEESNLMFAEIKENLGRAVQLRDIKVGAKHWVGQLDKYLSIYYHKFSKTDHILLVKLLYELLTMPMQEFCLVEKIAKVLNNLLKKKNYLSREDLILRWRPLYEVMKKFVDEKATWRVYSSRFENAMNNVIKAASHYFHEDATQEMLDEWLPWLCPLDTMAVQGLQFLEAFLPTSLPPELHNKGFKLWLDEFLQLWHSFHSAPSWEGSLVSLFSRLAHRNVSYIDWTPHIPMIFTRLLRSFNLPVGNRQAVPVRNNNAYDINNMSMWIVGMMGGPDNIIQEHLTKLFKALHSFYHPSNIGKWTTRLGSFLQNLPKFFVYRLRRENFKVFKWLPPIPESYKLTPTHVTEFVECVKFSVFVAMFSKFGSQDAAAALRSLAVLRPEIMIPPLLEKTYPAMETLIEPHRLIACMICVVSVARPMMSSRQQFPEGRSHVLPLLRLALPGIDSNDFRKTLVTLQLVSTFVSLIPIVDVSDAYHAHPNLTEVERELCSATAQFEDFVLCLLDRVQNLVENSSQDSSFSNVERLNTEQTVLEMGLASTIATMLQQCSTPIFMSALKKIHRFATSSVFEVKVSGKLASNICRACVRIKPEIALKMFVPQICSSIQTFLSEHPGAVEEENLDDYLLWNILLLSQVVRCDGSKLLAYKEELLNVVSLTLQLKCVQGYTLASSLSKNILHSLTSTYPLEFRSVPFDLDNPPKDYLPIEDWGVFSDLGDLAWHTMSLEERDMAGEMMDRFLIPQLETFSQASAEKTIDKDDLLRRLTVVQNLFQGSSCILPTWEDEPYKLNDSQVPTSRFNTTIGLEDKGLSCKGRNMRESIHDALSHLLEYMATSQEDDTKSLFVITKIYECLMVDHGTIKIEFDARWKSYHIVKQSLKNVLLKEKKHSRTLMVDRIQLQHEIRNVGRSTRFFTKRHAKIMTELMQLSVSRYREVRKKSQAILHSLFRVFIFSYKTCVSQLADNLWNKELPEHIFKGSLFTISGINNTSCLASRVNWETLHKVWPALTQAQHSEKPSVLKVIDDILNRVFKNLETFALSFQTSQSAIDAAGDLLSSPSAPAIASKSLTTQQELQQGLVFEQQFNENAKRHYDGVIQELIDLVDNGDLTWKFKRIGLELLSLLLHDDAKPSPQMVEVYSKHLIHDMLYIRKLSFTALVGIMEIQKTPFVKIPVNVEKVCGVSPLDLHSLIPGDRPDNAWVKFDPAKMIETEEEWNSTVFVEKTHWGFYTWPKELRTYAPSKQQPDLNRPPQELRAAELPLYNCLIKEDFVDKMVELLALEEEKNTDKFRLSIYQFFKLVFRNYGDNFLEPLKPHIERLLKDTSHDTHATSQRAAMEIMGGIISGSKMWSFNKTKSLWQWMCPLLQYGMNNLSVETLSDWGNMFLNVCGNRDPRKLQWMYSMLLENPLNGEGGAFGDSGRLFVIQHVVLQQEWRIPAYLHSLLNYLRPQMAHYYKTVRDRMGALLSCLHQMDYLIHPSSITESPMRADLLKSVLPQLEQFRDVILAHNNKTTESTSNTEESPMEGVETTDQGDEDKKEAVRLCKTVVRWVGISFAKSMSAIPVEIFQLLPILENLQSEANDEDLRKDCNAVMLDLAQVLLPPNIIPSVLQTIKEVSGLKTWRARAGILTYTQQLVFGNFFQMQEPSLRQAVQSLLLHLLCDEQLEVREMAAVTLSGMIHCGYLDMDKEMRAHFERLRKTKVKLPKGLNTASSSSTASTSSREPVSLQSLIQRHAGVLGLSAYIQAYPYDVPEFIPQILMDLSVHVNDPQPIGTTVTKTLSKFRHTHHDNWHDHKTKFTDDQLVTLTDLLISPNYYA